MDVYAINNTPDPRISDFLQWLRSLGITVSRKLEIADLRASNAGRGIGIGPSLKAPCLSVC